MPCAEITNAIAWSKQSTAKEKHPVVAYLTKQYGMGGTAATISAKDAVIYASGEVVAIDTPSPHLEGTLKVAKNTDQAGLMTPDAALTCDVKVFPDGTIDYLMKINGTPIGGLPATKVKATNVNDVLLTAADKSTVVTVGVARKPSAPGDPW